MFTVLAITYVTIVFSDYGYPYICNGDEDIVNQAVHLMSTTAKIRHTLATLKSITSDELLDPMWRKVSHYAQVCLITQCCHKCDSSSGDYFDFVESSATSWLRHHGNLYPFKAEKEGSVFNFRPI